MKTQGWKLVNASGAEVAIGSEVKTFRDETVVVTGFEPPLHEASTGRIYVKEPTGYVSSYYPSVCDLKIVREE